MESKSFIITFKENVPGRYWYLYWIGKVIFESNLFKIKLYFLNTEKPDNFYNSYKDCGNHKQEIVLPIENLVFLTPGAIYDSKRKKVLSPSSYNKDEWNVKIDFPFDYRKTGKDFPFLLSKYSPLSEGNDLEGFNYYAFGGSKNRKIVTDHVLCKYFFFKSSKFISSLMRVGINEMFDVNDIKIIISNGKRVGILKYNNNCIGIKDVELIAPFFFTKGGIGIKTLVAIETKVLSFFINNKDNLKKINEGVYLDTSFPFSDNVSFFIQGKKFNVDGNDYFISERIVNHEHNPNLFLIDEIRVEEFFPKSSTADKKSLDAIKTNIKAQPLDKSKELKLTAESNLGDSQIDIVDNYIGLGNVSGFKFLVKKIIRDSQDNAYDVSLIPTDEEIHDATIVNQESESGLSSIRNNFIEEFINPEYLSRFELMKLTVRKLEEEYQVRCEFNCLDNVILNNEIYVISKRPVMIISLFYKNRYFYLVEFNRGFTGFIHDKNMDRIDPFKLDLFLKASVRKIDELSKNQYVWTKIAEFSEVTLEKLGIVIGNPLKHNLLNYEKASDAALFMAKKIFEERISKIVA
jgi:hypothetical protein